MQIHSALAGRTIDAVLTDGKRLIFQSGSHEIVVLWDEELGFELERINVKIILPGVLAESVAAQIVGD